jgi:predicted nucleic acid-binding protein
VLDSLEAIDPAWQIVQRAGGLAEQHALRGYDAVHLATALEVLGEDDVLVTWDDDLARAAQATGLAVVGSGGPP